MSGVKRTGDVQSECVLCGMPVCGRLVFKETDDAHSECVLGDVSAFEPLVFQETDDGHSDFFPMWPVAVDVWC